MQTNGSLSIYIGMIRDLCETLDGTRFQGKAVDAMHRCYEDLVDLEMELDDDN